MTEKDLKAMTDQIPPELPDGVHTKEWLDGYDEATGDAIEDRQSLEQAHESLQKKFNTVYENYQELQGQYLKAVGDLEELRFPDRVEPVGPYKPSVTPEQMQDGKRYRVTVEGEGNAYTDDSGRRMFLVLSNGDSPEEMNMFEIENATSIQEIGGEQ